MTNGEMPMSKASVGVIGFGLMGEVYAGRLVEAGFSVMAFDVDPAKTARMAKAGVRACAGGFRRRAWN